MTSVDILQQIRRLSKTARLTEATHYSWRFPQQEARRLLERRNQTNDENLSFSIFEACSSILASVDAPCHVQSGCENAIGSPAVRISIMCGSSARSNTS